MGHSPSSCIPHTLRWSDIRDAQDSDMLRQFISSQRGRIHHRLPEYIVIDPELTEDQNEERWWIHHWGLARQDMRASYLRVSAQVIDRLIHDLYRAHHHDRHDRRGSYLFEDMYPEFDIAYGGDVALLHYQERDELRRTNHLRRIPVRIHGPRDLP